MAPVYTIVVHTWEASVQTPLLNDHILADNQPMRGHFPQLGQNAVDMLVGIDERDDDGQLTSSFDQMSGMDFAASEKAGYGVEGDGSENIFLAQIFQNLQMQRTMMPGVAFGEMVT